MYPVQCPLKDWTACSISIDEKPFPTLNSQHEQMIMFSQ